MVQLQRYFVGILIVGICSALTPISAKSAELLMLEQVGCYWCQKWNEEIGDIYPKTTESKIAPLRRVDIHHEWPEDLKNVRIDQFTPTFVVVEKGEEIGRLRGYAGDQFFWPLLNEILKKIPQDKETSG